MRDLARSDLGRRRKTSRSKLLLYIAAFIVLGVVLYYVGGDTGTTQNRNELIADAPTDLTPVSLAGQENLAANAVSLNPDTAKMKDLRDEDSSATVVRSYGGGAYRLSVNANLPDPVNVNYAVWLTGTGNPWFVEYMRGSGRDWYVNIAGKESELLKYDGVLISLERTKDNKVEEKIMEGSF